MKVASAVSRAAVRPLRLLFFVPVCVYPVSHGGASKFTNIVWGLSERGHEVHVLSLVGDEAEREQMRSLPKVATSEAYVIPPETSYFPGSAVPAAVRGTYRPAMGRHIEEAVRHHGIDILQLDFTHSAAYVPNSLGRPTVLVEIDIAYRSAFRSAVKQDGILKTAFGLFDASRLYHWELHNVRKADLVLASSEHEAAILRRHGIAKVSGAVPNGVDVAACEPQGARCETRDILFVGHFGHPPNVDALRHFVSSIWPHLRSQDRELSVSVVGPGLPSDLVSQVRGCGFRHAGYVDDLRAELWSHRVFIAPIRLGAGTRIKLLEAAAARCAMVSTTLGAEGLGLRDGQDLLIADAPEDFARSVERLLDDGALRARLGASAHDSVKRRFDAPALAASLEGLYYRLLEWS